MTRLAPVMLTFLLAACGPGPGQPEVGGETNWLRRCTGDDGCGGLRCLCGVCAPPCTQDECAAGQQCVAPEQAQQGDLCAAQETDVGLCLPACDGANDCPPATTCREGLCLPPAPPALAFPQAVGFGAGVSGGRFGSVQIVDQLGASGPGSLQAALDAPGPRTVVFAVSGVIQADVVHIPHGDLTLAGQSAPGAGITLAGRLVADEPIDNVLIRHVRIRPQDDGSDPAQLDALRLWQARSVMLDHVSVAFGIDENVDLFSARDVTLQHSSVELAAGSLVGRRNAGLIAGPEATRISIVGNLFAHAGIWSPGIARGPAEVVGNLIFDAQTGFMHGNPASGPFNLVGNHFEAGPERTLTPFYFDDANEVPAADLAYYLQGNAFAGEPGDCTPGAMDDPWQACTLTQRVDGSHRVTDPHDFSSVSEAYVAPAGTTAQQARRQVVIRVGALPHDTVTRQVLDNFAAGRGVDTPTYPADYAQGLTPTRAPPDADRDGLPDGWERSHGLDPSDPYDHRVQLEAGYSALELYLQERAAALEP